MKLPSFENGLRVVRQYDINPDRMPLLISATHAGKLVHVDCNWPNHRAPLAEINGLIEGWPQHPITAEQVAAFIPRETERAKLCAA